MLAIVSIPVFIASLKGRKRYEFTGEHRKIYREAESFSETKAENQGE
jgi:hypothetical protein